MAPELAIAAFKKHLPHRGPYKVEEHNDTGPGDEGYWRWWEVAGIKFNTESMANAFVDILQSNWKK